MIVKNARTLAPVLKYALNVHKIINSAKIILLYFIQIDFYPLNDNGELIFIQNYISLHLLLKVRKLILDTLIHMQILNQSPITTIFCNQKLHFF